jgi:phosphate acetyltransferase
LCAAVVYPVDEVSLAGAIEAAKKNLIVPLLVGPEVKIRAVRRPAKVGVLGYDLVQTEHSHAAAQAFALVGAAIEALMNGSPHPDELMGAIVRETDRPLTRSIEEACLPCWWAIGKRHYV